MYTLSFKKSNSKYFLQALDLALELGAKYDGETVILEMPTHQLLYAYESLYPLLGLIQNWSSAKATFRGKNVGVYRFIFLVWRIVRECAEEYNNTSDDRHCWYGTDSPGWGCKHLNRIFRDPQGPGNYKTSNRY